jgi:hypothetical protein
MRFVGAFLGGLMTTLGLILQVLPVGILGVGLAFAFIVMLPRQPMVLAGLGAGTVLTLAALSISWVSGDWGCASEVDGRLVEHDCGSGPTATGE